MKTLYTLILAAACGLLASCGGGGGEPGDDAPPPTSLVTFSFRMQGMGADQEFRFATDSQDFIAKARAQLQLPVADRNQFPIGPIAAGNGGVNLGWGWHFTSLSLAEASIELCDGSPSMVQDDLPYWLNTVKSFCPWGGYVYAEVTGTYPLPKMALGEVREVKQENLRVEVRDIRDNRCPAAALCVAPGHAEVDLSVRVGDGAAQALTVTLDAGARDQQAALGPLRFTLDRLEPYPINDPIPKSQYRADLTVRRI